METWPGTLPQDLHRQLEASVSAGLADPKEQINAIRTRTYPERESTFEVMLSQTQLETLLTFYKTTLNDGCLLFDADWLTDAGFDFHHLRFARPFRATNKGLKWSVKMDLIIIAGVPFDGGVPTIWPCEV